MGLLLQYKKHGKKYYNSKTDREIKYKNLHKYPDHYVAIFDNNANLIRKSYSNCSWCEWKYDKYGNVIRYDDSDGEYAIWQYNEQHQTIYYEDWECKLVSE